MMWGYGWGWGPMVGMGVTALLFWVLIIAGIAALVRYLLIARDHHRWTGAEQSSRAEQALAERFARGEIDEDEYQHRREVLRGVQ